MLKASRVLNYIKLKSSGFSYSEIGSLYGIKGAAVRNALASRGYFKTCTKMLIDSLKR